MPVKKPKVTSDKLVDSPFKLPYFRMETKGEFDLHFKSHLGPHSAHPFNCEGEDWPQKANSHLK